MSERTFAMDTFSRKIEPSTPRSQRWPWIGLVVKGRPPHLLARLMIGWRASIRIEPTMDPPGEVAQSPPSPTPVRQSFLARDSALIGTPASRDSDRIRLDFLSLSRCE